MLLILEIWLTVAAWRKGWGALALIPGAVVLMFGFLLGASGANPDDVIGLCFAGDLLTVIVLGVMASRGYESASKPDTSKQPENTDTSPTSFTPPSWS